MSSLYLLQRQQPTVQLFCKELDPFYLTFFAESIKAAMIAAGALRGDHLCNLQFLRQKSTPTTK